jgi:protoheme IX farnesyltransferase
MFAITLLPYVTRMSGPLYLAGALLLGGRFIWHAGVLLWGEDRKAAINTFKYSITYLMLLFLVMLVDHYLFPVSTLS